MLTPGHPPVPDACPGGRRRRVPHGTAVRCRRALPPAGRRASMGATRSVEGGAGVTTVRPVELAPDAGRRPALAGRAVQAPPRAGAAGRDLPADRGHRRARHPGGGGQGRGPDADLAGRGGGALLRARPGWSSPSWAPPSPTRAARTCGRGWPSGATPGRWSRSSTSSRRPSGSAARPAITFVAVVDRLIVPLEGAWRVPVALAFVWATVALAVAPLRAGKRVPLAGAAAQVGLLGFFTLTVLPLRGPPRRPRPGRRRPGPLLGGVRPGRPRAGLQLPRLRAALGGRRGAARPGPRRPGLDRPRRRPHLRPVRGPGAGHRAGRPGRPAHRPDRLHRRPGHRVRGLRALGGPGRGAGRAGPALDPGRQRAHLGDGVLAHPGRGQPRRRRPGRPRPGLGQDGHAGDRHPGRWAGRHRHHPGRLRPGRERQQPLLQRRPDPLDLAARPGQRGRVPGPGAAAPDPPGPAPAPSGSPAAPPAPWPPAPWPPAGRWSPWPPPSGPASAPPTPTPTCPTASPASAWPSPWPSSSPWPGAGGRLPARPPGRRRERVPDRRGRPDDDRPGPSESAHRGRRAGRAGQAAPRAEPARHHLLPHLGHGGGRHHRGHRHRRRPGLHLAGGAVRLLLHPLGAGQRRAGRGHPRRGRGRTSGCGWPSAASPAPSPRCSTGRARRCGWAGRSRSWPCRCTGASSATCRSRRCTCSGPCSSAWPRWAPSCRCATASGCRPAAPSARSGCSPSSPSASSSTAPSTASTASPSAT